MLATAGRRIRRAQWRATVVVVIVVATIIVVVMTVVIVVALGTPRASRRRGRGG